MAFYLEGPWSLSEESKTAGMKYSIKAAGELELLLQPETPIEEQLLQAEAFRKGLMWGKPRFGHPEGIVALHVREILDNIDRLSITNDQRQQLRLIALAHDTFKIEEPRTIPRDWGRHHAVLARRFMEQFTDDKVVLTVLELHDEAFYIWRRMFLQNQQELGKLQLRELFQRLEGMLGLYFLFFYCDTRTGDKLQAPLDWFEKVLKTQGLDTDQLTADRP